MAVGPMSVLWVLLLGASPGAQGALLNQRVKHCVGEAGPRHWEEAVLAQ